VLAKRFGSLSSYRASETAGYKLLPVRFTPLDANRYVLSNIAGEFRVVTRDVLEALVTRKIEIGTDLYDDLKSGHFLYDGDSDVALELLGRSTAQSLVASRNSQACTYSWLRCVATTPANIAKCRGKLRIEPPLI
jgi:uncharacterized protein